MIFYFEYIVTIYNVNIGQKCLVVGAENIDRLNTVTYLIKFSLYSLLILLSYIFLSFRLNKIIVSIYPIMKKMYL